MTDSELSLEELYDWAVRWQDELTELHDAFPEWLKIERNRVVASVSCWRVSCEIRLKHRPTKRPDAPSTGVRPHEPSSRLSRLYRGGADGAGPPSAGRL